MAAPLYRWHGWRIASIDSRALQRGRQAATRFTERLRRSISEFLAIPILIVLGFFGFAILIYVFDHDAGSSVHWGPLRTMLGRYVGDGQSAAGLLTTIAGSLITVTSITFSILLLAVQQGASALTSQIIDHYLRRPSNRVYFGFFVGTSVFALVTLVLTTSGSRPVLGVTFATLFTCVALFALILLIYSTIDQIRPISVVGKIHDTALTVRKTQATWLVHTMSPETETGPVGTTVTTDRNGYLARVRVEELRRIAERQPAFAITVLPSVGEFLVGGTPLAIVEGMAMDERLERAVRHALPVEEQRDVGCDAAASVDHLVNIAWTTISTAKSNPAVSAVACDALKDILFRWADEDEAPQGDASIVRYRDATMPQLLDGLESLVVVTSESMQHQALAIIMDAMSLAFERATPIVRDRLEAILMTSLPALGDHLPTGKLKASFARAAAALRRDGRTAGADRLDAAWRQLAAVRGVIRSRGNRDQSQGD